MITTTTPALRRITAGLAVAAGLALGFLTLPTTEIVSGHATSPSGVGALAVASADPDACAGIAQGSLGTAACDQQRMQERHQRLQDTVDRQREKPYGNDSPYCTLFPSEAKCQQHTTSGGVPTWLVTLGVIGGLLVVGFIGIVAAGAAHAKREAAALDVDADDDDSDKDWDDEDDDDEDDDDWDEIVDYPEETTAPAAAPTSVPAAPATPASSTSGDLWGS